MTRENFLQEIDEILEKEPGTLKGGEDLEEVGWDSLSVISFIALVDEKLGFTVAPADVARSKTVNDLIALAQHKFEA